MTALSLLEGCQNIFEKSHETWKSYFSKWETLADLEENLPDDAFVSEEKAPEKRQKRKTASLKNKRLLKKKVVTKKEVVEKNKKKTAGKVIERPEDSGNENLPEEKDNKQLEMHLRTIFMDILKANKNKWEVFAVLSQTFSHKNVTIKCPHSLRPNHRLALPSNDTVQSGREVLFRKVEVFSPNTTSVSFLGGRISLSGVGFFESCFPALSVREKKTLNCSVPQNHDNAFRQAEFTAGARQIFPDCTAASPHAARLMSNFKPRPPSLSNISSPYNKVTLKPPALDFPQNRAPEGCSKIKNENFYERNIPEMNITREEKRFGSLCLHKRTNDLNMENSNFITPERNPSERKCFSENISQRKRRRPAKLFFDFRDSSDSENDEQNKSSAPRIGWHSKTHKVGVNQEVITMDSDSDESDRIL